MVYLSLQRFLEPLEQVLIFLVLSVKPDVILRFFLTSNFFGSFSLYELKVLLLSFAKKWVFKHQTLIFLLNLVKIIHVKLPNKRRKIWMSEILGQYFPCKRYNIMDDKSDITFIPRNHAFVFGVFKDLVCFKQKWSNRIRRTVVIAGLFFVHIFLEPI